MEKKYEIVISKIAVVQAVSKEEAFTIADLIASRESDETVFGNLLFVTTEVKELEYV